MLFERTVLVVDDDREFRELIAPVLSSLGLRVLQAALGKEGAEITARENPDLLIVDGLLPDTTGVEWIAALREQGNLRPIIFLSSLSAYGWGSRTIHRLTNELKVGVILQKPIIPSLFVEQVEYALRESAPVRPKAELDLERGLALLRTEYGKTLPAKLDELSRALDGAKEQAADPFKVAEARSQSHRLRGTAGSYGFIAIGEACGRIEDALMTMVDADPGRHPELWAEMKRALAEARRVALAIAPGVTGGVSAVGTQRLLAVDDDHAFLRYIEELGRMNLIEVMTARTSAEAIEKARRTPPHAALLDVILAPPDSAFTLVRHLRALPGCEKLPIAFASGASPIANRVAAAHAGASLFLPKPLDAETFAAATQQLFAERNATRARILAVDDDEDFLARVSALLGHAGMHVDTLRDSTHILEAIEERRPDLVLLDVLMPGISGYDICRTLRAVPRYQGLPVVVVTARSGLESRLAAFHAGADDYINKPFVDEELLARIQVRVERARLLRDRADKDALTGLLLRRAFMEALGSRLAEAARHERPLSVCLIDLDEFKKLNDGFGHLSGDRVLSGLGKLFASRFRLEDLRGRWGGEEFILGFPGEGADTVQAVVSRVLAEFSATRFEGDAGQPVSATFSAGVASFPEDGTTADALLRAADRRLYQAKRSGRAKVIREG